MAPAQASGLFAECYLRPASNAMALAANGIGIAPAERTGEGGKEPRPQSKQLKGKNFGLRQMPVEYRCFVSDGYFGSLFIAVERQFLRISI